MSETTIALSVAEARQRLQNTRNLSSEQIDDLQKIIAAFHAARPRNQSCVACHSMVWSEHTTADGGSSWCCAGCHRAATLTQEQWHADQKRERAAADAHLRATEAAAPKPRDTLKQALTRLTEAKAGLSKLERAVPVARAAVSEAQDRHDAAKAAVVAAETNTAEGVAAAFFEGTKLTGPMPSAAAAAAELADAIAALVVAKNAKAILDSRLKDAQPAVGYASDKCKKAARAVIAAEQLESLLTAATEGRAQYIDAVGALGWLQHNHALPDSDAARVRQLVADANMPPCAWPEAASAGTASMEAAMAALMADAEAPI